MLRRASVALICVVTGCAAAPERSEDAERWSVEIQQAITEQPNLDSEAVRALIPYEWITFERTMCLGPCPVYRVVFLRDGTAKLTTDHLSDDVRRYVGKISLKEFARLAQMVDAARKVSAWSSYRGQWTDDYEATITAGSYRESWTVTDYGEVAPMEVWALEQVLHLLRQDTEWTAWVRP
jgi:Domain of unknown function (DUF6438)